MNDKDYAYGIHDAYPSSMAHLSDIMDTLKDRVNSFCIGNRRARTQHFPHKSELKSKPKPGSRKPHEEEHPLEMNEPFECELLLGSIGKILHKWGRQVSLSSEVFIMLHDSIRTESIQREKLEHEIRRKETIIERVGI